MIKPISFDHSYVPNQCLVEVFRLNVWKETLKCGTHEIVVNYHDSLVDEVMLFGIAYDIMANIN